MIRAEASRVSPPEGAGGAQAGSPEALEEDEAELELQKQLEKGRRLRQLQQLRDSGEKVGGPGAGRERVRVGLSGAGVSGDGCAVAPGPREHGTCTPARILFFV